MLCYCELWQLTILLRQLLKQMNHDVKSTIDSKLNAPLEWQKLWECLFPSTVRECEKVRHSCTGLFTAAGCVCKCFARTYHGCGLQSLVSERERERERRVCFTSHPCEHIRTNTTVNMSELVSVCACVCVLAWASSLAKSLITLLLTDSLSPAFLLSIF